MAIARVSELERPSLNHDTVVVDDRFPRMDSSSAVAPTVRWDAASLTLAYHLPECEDSALVRFTGVSAWYYGGPNDEGLAAHRLYGKGLTFYNFHRDASSAAQTMWIATFHDGTFEIVADDVVVLSERARKSSPSEALDSIRGQASNTPLDR